MPERDHVRLDAGARADPGVERVELAPAEGIDVLPGVRGMHVRRVHRLRDDSSALIRLADALAGLARESADRPAVEALYLRAYSRKPSDKQWSTVEAFLASEREAGRSRQRAFENLLMVVINSKEFQINR